MCEDWMVECSCCSIALNVFTVIVLAVTVICASNDTTYNGLISPRDFVYIPFVLFLLFYFFYLLECYSASTRKHLMNALDGKTVHDYISEVKDASPTLKLKATSWHFESKTRSVCYIDARGKRKWKDERYRERSVTNSENEIFRFDRWEDQTSVPVEIENCSIVVLACKKSFQFTNEYSKQMFVNQSCAFQARNRHRDTHMDYETELELDSFVDQVIAVTVLNKKKNWWIKASWYWVFSIFLLSWPYRLILKRNCCFTSINFVKELHVCSA